MNQSERIIETLSAMQSRLKAPKNQFNAFGKYKYRSLEDILEGLKPLLAEYKAAVTIQDEMAQVGERIYVKAIATLHCGGEIMSVTAYAREAESKKGMDDSQVTGSTSSYARKYAMNGLFAIDDTKDADATNQHDKGNQGAKKATPASQPAPPPAQPGPEAITAAQLTKLNTVLTNQGITDRAAKLAIVNEWLDKRSLPQIESAKGLTKQQASTIIDHLETSGKATDFANSPMDEMPG